MPTTYLAGFLTGLSLIVAIGAQNAFVLRQGILRRHVVPVVAIAMLADAALIALGTAGAGAVVKAHPDVLAVLRWVGAAYLLWFGLRTLWEARHPQGLQAAASASGRNVILTALALTFLNPHVYLDTVLMLGNIANQHGVTGRWWFAAGAGVASIAWFTTLGFGATRLSNLFAKPVTWRILDGVIAATMMGLAVLIVAG